MDNENQNGVRKVANKRKKWKLYFFIIGVLILGAIVWFGSQFLFAASKITTENTTGKSPFLSFDDKITPSQLQGEGDGRINFLILGIGGKNHPGGQLTDTIIVASIDPKNKTAALLSLPRDLYVPIDGGGYSKINSAYSFGESSQKSGGGAAVMKKTVSNILDLPIHYYLLVDFEAFKKLVDSIGGVEVNVDKAISDPYYPDARMVGYDPFSISPGLQKMNGDLALKYARSRETTSDFDRAKRQQKLISAILDKTTSIGVLTNPKKVTEIAQILGEHLRTDLSIGEIQRLVSIVKEVDSSKIVSKVLDNGPDGPLVSSNNGVYYLKPKTGNFKEIQRIAHEIFSDPYLAGENAKIEVLNGTSKTGVANDAAQMLKSYGYQVINIGNASEKVTKTTIYDYSKGQKPFTVKFLNDRFKVKAVTKNPDSANKVDISIIIGDDWKN